MSGGSAKHRHSAFAIAVAGTNAAGIALGKAYAAYRFVEICTKRRYGRVKRCECGPKNRLAARIQFPRSYRQAQPRRLGSEHPDTALLIPRVGPNAADLGSRQSRTVAADRG